MEACLDSTWSLVSSRNDRMILLLPQTSEQRQKDYLSMFKYDNSLPKVTAAIFIVERTNKWPFLFRKSLAQITDRIIIKLIES